LEGPGVALWSLNKCKQTPGGVFYVCGGVELQTREKWHSGTVGWGGFYTAAQIRASGERGKNQRKKGGGGVPLHP